MCVPCACVREGKRDLSWCFELVELNEELALQRIRIKKRLRDFRGYWDLGA